MGTRFGCVRSNGLSGESSREDEPILRPRRFWRRNSSGIFAPVGIELEGELYLSDFSEARQTLRSSLLRHRIVVTPNYSDIWNEGAPDFAAVFGALPTGNWLSFLSRFALAIHSPVIDIDDFQLRWATVLKGADRARLVHFMQNAHQAALFSEFSVLTALELALIYSNAGEDSADLDDAQLQSIFKGVILTSERLNQSKSLTKHSAGGYAAALAERSRLTDGRLFLTRAYNCWIRDLKLTSEQKAFRKTIDAQLFEHVGVTLADWIRAISLFALSHLAQPIEEVVRGARLYNPAKWFKDDRLRAASQRMFEALSTDEDGLRNGCSEIDSQTPLADSPVLTPLIRYPILRSQQEKSYLILSPMHMCQAAFEFPLRCLPNPEEKQSFRTMTEIIESHVHWILTMAFGDRYTPLDRAKKRKRADGIIWYEDAFIVVECKAGRRPDWMLYQERDDAAYIDELRRRDLPKAFAQIDQTISDVMDKVIDSRCTSPPHTAASLIVTYDELPLSIIGESVLEPILPKTVSRDGITRLRPQIVSLSEIEQIDQWRGSRLIDKLVEKMADPSTSLEALGSYLAFKKDVATEPQIQNSLMDDIFEFVKSWLQ